MLQADVARCVLGNLHQLASAVPNIEVWIVTKSAVATRPAAMTQKEEQLRRRSQLWLTGAAAAVAAYFLLSGQYIDFSVGYEYDEDDEPEDE